MPPVLGAEPRKRAAALALDAVADDRSRVSRYKSYWRKITPSDPTERFRRWLFAYASVQTGWKRNIVIYEALAAPGLSFDPQNLEQVLTGCGAGMQRVRSRGLARFHADYWSAPDEFLPSGGETFAACRDRLVPRVYGLGVAKVSFALEMVAPLECDAVCLDRHLLRLYGVDPEAATLSGYKTAEAHWRRACARRGLPCPIARHIVWDRVQGQRSTRYWSRVFETN
jgi:hypothetical protein